MEREKPVIDFAEYVRTYEYNHLRDQSWIAGRARRGCHRLDPAPFPADDGTPSAPADDQHSRQWCAQNGRGRVRGSSTGEAQRPSAPGRRARKSPPTPRRTPLDNRSTSRGGWASETAGSGRVSGAVAHLSKSRRAAQRRDATTDRMLGMGDHRPAVG